MSDLDRYTTDVDGQLVQSDEGELVHYSKYLELEAQRDELRYLRDGLKESIALVEQQRDELLVALNDIVTAYKELSCDEAEPVMHRIAVEVLAKHGGSHD